MTSGDLFSQVAGSYAQYRPTYPDSLYQYLAVLVSQHELAWDCGTGNGQAAAGLANHFKRVWATDSSLKQVQKASRAANVMYQVSCAEESGLADESVDLVTVAQAVHWFDLEPFYAEVRRVTRPGAVLSVWCYNHFKVDPDFDQQLLYYYHDILGPYWAPQIRYVDEHYSSLPFPFALLTSPEMELETYWDLGEVLGYLKSWSARASYMGAKGKDPLTEMLTRFEQFWGDPAQKRHMTWPLYFKIGRI